MKKLKSLYRHITCAVCGASFNTELNHSKSKKGDSESKAHFELVCPYCSRDRFRGVKGSKNEQDA